MVIAAVIVSASAGQALAQPVSFLAWNNALGGSYNAAGNWLPIGVPEGPFLGAAFSLNAFYTVGILTDINVAAALVTDGTVIWDMDASGTSRTYSPGSLGVGSVSGGASLVVGGGVVETPSLLVSNNGILTVNADAQVDAFDGTATIDGQGSVWTQSAGVRVGDDAIGTLNILNGGEVNSSNFTGTGSFVGVAAGSHGTATVQGMGSTKHSIWDTVFVTVGGAGHGTMNILDGGVVEGIGNVGSSPGSMGDVTVDGAGSMWTGGTPVFVGVEGAGTMSVRNAGAVDSDGGVIGFFSGSTGTVTVEGPGSTWTTVGLSTSVIVGQEGTGTLIVADGGRVDAQLNVAVGGFLAGHNGTGTLRFGIGDDGAGLLDVGGELSVRDGTALFDLYVDDGVALAVNDSFTLVDYGTLEPGFAFDNLSDDQTFDAGPYSFLVDFNADLTGGGDFGMVATVTAIAPALLGDANNDGQVTGADLIAVQQNFGNAGPANGFLLGDANDDGFVTGTDLISVQQNFGNVLGPAPESVPEPGALFILAWLCAGAMRRTDGTARRDRP